jgi:hypothetical protein
MSLSGEDVEIFVFIDSDDRLHTTHLSNVRKIFRRYPDVAVVCCDALVIDTDGKVLFDGSTFQTMEAMRKRINITTGYRTFDEIFRMSTSFPGMSIRRDAFIKWGGFDKSVFPLDDVDLQLRLAASGVGVYYIHKALADYRKHPQSASAGTGQAFQTCQKKVECLERWGACAPKSTSKSMMRSKLSDVYLELALAAIDSRRFCRALKAILRSLALNHKVMMNFILWRLERHMKK